MSIAERIKKERKRANMTLDELAKKADVSRTYLWELEADTEGEKQPSAAVLFRIAHALSTTIADLMSLPVVEVDDGKIDLAPSLIEFRDYMDGIGEAIPEQDVRDLARMRFRGGQPKTKEDWHDLYRMLKRSTGR